MGEVRHTKIFERNPNVSINEKDSDEKITSKKKNEVNALGQKTTLNSSHKIKPAFGQGDERIASIPPKGIVTPKNTEVKETEVDKTKRLFVKDRR